MSRYDRRAKRLRRRVDWPMEEPVAALPLFPPLRRPAAAQTAGWWVFGGLGAMVGFLADSRRMARQPVRTPPGATVPLDGTGLFVVVGDRWVVVHRGAQRPRELLLRAPRRGSHVHGQQARGRGGHVWRLVLSLSGGEVIVGQTPGEGFGRAVRRFLDAFDGPEPRARRRR